MTAPGRPPVSDEFALLARLRPALAGSGPGVPLGVGDDAAVVEVGGAPVAIAVDALVEGVHFDLSLSDHADVGWKALAVNVSDLAAVGAGTTAAVVALQRPDDLADDAVVALYSGLGEAAERWDVALVGGDVVGAPVLSLAVAVVGAPFGSHLLRRDGARPGDAVVVVGRLGLAAAALHLHRAGRGDLLAAHPELAAAHRRPVALPEAARALVAVGAHACIDVSDGLGRDAGHVARASGVALHLDAERLPVHPGVGAAARALGADVIDLVVGGGDDHALVAAVAPEDVDRLRDLLAGSASDLAVVGDAREGGGVHLRRGDGRTVDVSRSGWEHGGRRDDAADDEPGATMSHEPR